MRDFFVVFIELLKDAMSEANVSRATLQKVRGADPAARSAYEAHERVWGDAQKTTYYRVQSRSNSSTSVP